MSVKTNIIVQDIAKEDIPEIIELALNTPELHINNEPEYYSKETLESFIKSPNDIYLIAKINGQTAGYRLATFNPFLKEAYLIDMVVKDNYRGLGVANALYNKTFELLNQKGCVWAWALVQEENTRMQQILAKKGFIKGKLFYYLYKNHPF